jgi:hypothetical protein
MKNAEVQSGPYSSDKHFPDCQFASTVCVRLLWCSTKETKANAEARNAEERRDGIALFSAPL